MAKDSMNNEPMTGPKQPPKPRGKQKKQMKFEMKFTMRNILIWLLVLLFGLPLLLSMFPTQDGDEIALSEAITDIREGKVQEILVQGDTLTLSYEGDVQKTARKEPGASVTDIFSVAEIDPAVTKVVVEDGSLSRIWTEILFSLLPIVGMGVLLLFLFRQARGAQESIFSFGQSKAKLFDKGKQSVRFKDVAGVDEAKNELEEVVDFLKHPAKYKAVGARTPKGVLLVGPSGVGKTLLAKAVAGEAGVPYYSMAGSEFMEMLVGVGASRVRDLFATAKKNAPAIIFIDEIDAIGRQRGSGFASGAHDEREQTLNQILVEMDGFTPNDNVIVLAATNRGDLLDSALLRPGRFDRRVQLELPDVEGRKRILKIHAKGKPFAKDVSWERAAKRTVGFSGADLENMLNEAAIQAAKADRREIIWEDVEEAATKVKLGPEKRRLQTELEKKMTAYHEAGHALVSFYCPRVDPVHRISIVSRGMALGYTMVHPIQERVQETKSQLTEMMAMMLGGRAAEELIFQEQTGGAANDLERATRIARNMIMVFGMSDKVGPMFIGKPGEGAFERQPVSDGMQVLVDKEIQKELESAMKKAMDILTNKKEKLVLIAEKLLEVETLEGEEFEKLLDEERPTIPGMEPVGKE